MAVAYSTIAINFRLEGVVAAIDSGASNGVLQLLDVDGTTVLVSIIMLVPSGTASGGVLTFSGAPGGTVAIAGNATTGRIENSDGVIMISNLTVGAPLSSANIIIANGLNSTALSVGQNVMLVSGQIVGS